MAVASIPRMDRLSSGPIEIYEDEETPLETPDLLDGDYSSQHEDSLSDSDASESPEPAPLASQQPTPRHRELSAATAIHVAQPDHLSLDDDCFSDDEARKVSDVFSTLSDDHDQNLPPPSFYDVHKLQPSTPTKLRGQRERSVFRSPSSVRALQMSSPHPFQPFSPSPSSDRYRRSGTPGTNMIHSRAGTPLQAPKPKKEYPLILLHVTVTLTPLQYSLESLVELLPSWVLENHALLHDKASDTVLERGILIAHPRDDYELLEERILESLELQLARIYKCGHFDAGVTSGSHGEHLEEVHEDEKAETEEDGVGEFTARTCSDCGREIHSGAHGTSSGGTRRWDMKIYAANGLMRAGAWAAAWSEMEKVDLEIGVWIPEESRALLEDRRKKEMQDALTQAEALQHQAEQDLLQSQPTPGRTSALDEFSSVASKYSSRSVSSQSRRPAEQVVPLSTLLHNYLVRAAQDGRNIMIVALVVLLLFISTHKDSPGTGMGSQDLQTCRPQEHIQMSSAVHISQAAVSTSTNAAQHSTIAQTVASLTAQTSASLASEAQSSVGPEVVETDQPLLDQQPAEADAGNDLVQPLHKEHTEL